MRRLGMDHHGWTVTALIVLVIAVFYVGYHARADLASRLRAGCVVSQLDRLDTLRVRQAQARSDGAIARDRTVPVTARREKTLEYRVETASIPRLQANVDRAHGGHRDCSKVFPSPGLSPF